MKQILLASTVIFAATSAFAADAIVYNEPAPVVVADTFSWTGGYIGVNAGYAGGKAKTDYTVTDYDQFVYSNTDKQNLNGFIGGIQAGYNWQHNQMVFGLETDIQGTSMKKNTIVDAGWLNPGDYATLENKINWLGTTRARIGFLPTENLLAYVTAGVAYGGVKSGLSDTTGRDITESKTKFGYAVGAGLEYALNNNWTVKGEYLYADLGNVKYQLNLIDSDNVASVKSKFHANIVRVGLNYKF